MIKGKMWGIGRGSVFFLEHPSGRMHPAEREYWEWNLKKVREERRRIWDGRRYRWAMCNIYDCGLREPVSPNDGDEQLVREANGHSLSSVNPMRREKAVAADKMITRYLLDNGESAIRNICEGTGLSKHRVVTRLLYIQCAYSTEPRPVPTSTGRMVNAVHWGVDMSVPNVITPLDPEYRAGGLDGENSKRGR